MDGHVSSNTSSSGGPMVLNKKRLSQQSPQTSSANLIDDGEFISPDNHVYNKQLDLLAEMGFHDREFNLKTLKAANGNMQDALEIIVAANQKLRNKPSVNKAPPSKNILDELDSISPAPATTSQAWPEEPIPSPIVPIESQFASVSLDEPWGSIEESKPVKTKIAPLEETHEPEPQSQEYQSQDYQYNEPEPHEPESTEQETSNEQEDTHDYSNDPLAFNPFKSSTTPYSDDLFANPW